MQKCTTFSGALHVPEPEQRVPITNQTVFRNLVFPEWKLHFQLLGSLYVHFFPSFLQSNIHFWRFCGHSCGTSGKYLPFVIGPQLWAIAKNTLESKLFTRSSLASFYYHFMILWEEVVQFFAFFSLDSSLLFYSISTCFGLLAFVEQWPLHWPWRAPLLKSDKCSSRQPALSP